MKQPDRAEMAVFFYGFIRWLMESALAEGISKLYFFTREGEFLKVLYEKMAQIQFPRRSLPAAEILEVSRMSTFLPSCSEMNLNACMRIWNQYETQSMSALMQSFHIKLHRMQKYFDRYEIDSDERIVKPWEDKRVQALFEDQEFIHVLTAEKEKKKRLLYRYLAGKGFAEEEKKKIGIVDIGWRGTIQDNLCYLYPDYEITGFYIGLQQFLSPQPSNSRKYGYINPYPLSGMILMFVTPMEMLCNSPNGSTLAYEEKDGCAYAVKQKEKQENAVFFQYTGNRQQEILAGMEQYCRLADRKKQTAKQRNKKAYRALYQFAAWPDQETANAYFSLKHNEAFGMGCSLDKRKIPGLRQFGKMLIGSYKKGAWKEFLKMTTWPQGYFVKYRLYPFLVVYNVFMLPYILIQRKRNRSEWMEHNAGKKSHISLRD